jgi:uracil-DNA glycosylase
MTNRRWIEDDDYQVIDTPRYRVIEERVTNQVLKAQIAIFSNIVSLVLGALAFTAVMRALTTLEIIFHR